MPKADELYLLSQQCKDICEDRIANWEVHFKWLEDVILLAKQSKGEALIPKTPATKRKRKNDIENQPPPEVNDVEPPTLRKSSRTAAKTAQEKTKKTLIKISNLHSKLRRPTTPIKKELYRSRLKRDEVTECYDDDTKTEEVCASADKSNTSNSETHSSICLVASQPMVAPEESLSCLKSGRKSDCFSSIDQNEEANHEKNSHASEVCEIVNNNKYDVLNDNANSSNTSVSGSLSLQPESKTISLSVDPLKVINNHKKDDFSLTASTEDIREPAEEIKTVRPTRTKKKGKYTPSKDSGISVDETFKIPLPPLEAKELDANENSEERPVRSSRSKKKLIETTEETATRVTRTKKRKIQEVENLGNLEKSNDSQDDLVSAKPSHNTEQTDPLPIPKSVPLELPARITRSKVRQLANDSSPSLSKNFQTKVKENFSPIRIMHHSTSSQSLYCSPHAKQRNIKRDGKVATDILEVSIENIEVSTTGKIVKHVHKENTKNTMHIKWKTQYQTPSPASLSAIKILNLKNVYSSGTLQSSYANKRGPLLPSPQFSGPKLTLTPTEGNRPKNILTGMSFITRVQPSKPSREESEERKQEELKRKKEKGEETRRKKEEIMKARAEEQKRKNEERMKKVRERKIVMEREAQAKEKRMKEERIKEERKRMIAKKNEELRQQQLQMRMKLRPYRPVLASLALDSRHRREGSKGPPIFPQEQIEEAQRLQEELIIKEEQKQREAQRLEEQRKEEIRIQREELLKLEQERINKMEEQRKLLEQKREADRIAKEKFEREKLIEAHRIAREREELENLKKKETDRSGGPEKVMNKTYTAEGDQRLVNTTFNKTPVEGSKQCYEVTLIAKSTKSKNPNDYGITDLKSDDSTDEDCSPKKEIPQWAQGTQLRKHVFNQEHFPPNADLIFPPRVLLRNPDLAQIFPKHRSRFFKRTSSAVWNTPPCKVLPVEMR